MFLQNIKHFIKDQNELTQRCVVATIMIVCFGIPIIVGGSIFVFLLLIICVLATSECIAITKEIKMPILLIVIIDFYLAYLLRFGNNGLHYVIYLATIVATFDSAAYFAGKAIGRHKLCSNISPAKTIEGFVVGIICAAIVSILMLFILSSKVSVVASVLLAVILAALCQSGDIIESAFKRRYNVKDSSNLLPGHGGILDRFDGYILTVPMLFILSHVMPLF